MSDQRPELDEDGRWLSEAVRRNWLALCPDADGAVVARVADEVARDYAQPHRRWHTAFHVRDMHAALTGLLADLRTAGPGGSRSALLTEAACLYHDRVYVPGAPGNEADSAALFEADARRLGLPETEAATVSVLVVATEHHDPARLAGHDHLVRLAAVLCDADMAILGAEPARYERYRRAVREEYAALPDEHWRAGRGAFLTATLASRRIFHTDEGHARWDAPARANLRAELESLAA